MLVCRAARFIFSDEGTELAKLLLKCVNCLDAFDLQGDYRIAEAFLGRCWLGSALWDKCTKIRNGLINQFDIIIHLD